MEPVLLLGALARLDVSDSLITLPQAIEPAVPKIHRGPPHPRVEVLLDAREAHLDSLLRPGHAGVVALLPGHRPLMPRPVRCKRVVIRHHQFSNSVPLKRVETGAVGQRPKVDAERRVRGHAPRVLVQPREEEAAAQPQAPIDLGGESHADLITRIRLHVTRRLLQPRPPPHRVRAQAVRGRHAHLPDRIEAAPQPGEADGHDVWHGASGVLDVCEVWVAVGCRCARRVDVTRVLRLHLDEEGHVRRQRHALPREPGADTRLNVDLRL
mmetsp:Transcript_33864/g.66016  ORF Transcript_33864/g.66016 Transcript_33864/m.66016 type:complete len:268 (+) Transcript_33864:274-1077(+)